MIDYTKQGRAAKAKGKRGERELAEWMTKISGVKYGRTPASGAYHLDFAFDVYKRENKPSIFDGVGNENKNTKNLRVGDWIKQIETAMADYIGASEVISPRWFIRFKHKGKAYFILPEFYLSELYEQIKRNKAIRRTANCGEAP